MIFRRSDKLKRLFFVVAFAATGLSARLPLRAMTCVDATSPTLENNSPAKSEPLLFSVRNREEVSAAMSWSWMLLAGGSKKVMVPVRIQDSRFFYIWLPELQVGDNHKISASPPEKCKQLCGRLIDGKSQPVIYDFTTTNPPKGTIPWGLYLTGVSSGLRILPFQALIFSAPAGPISKGHAMLLRVEQKGAQGKRKVAVDVIPTSDIPQPMSRVPYKHSGHSCTERGFVLQSGDSYSVILYAGRNGGFEPISGWTFSIPLPPVWSDDDVAEFDRQYEAATEENKKCDALAAEKDPGIRTRCQTAYDTLFSLELKRDEKNGVEFNFGADKLALKSIPSEGLIGVTNK